MREKNMIKELLVKKLRGESIFRQGSALTLAVVLGISAFAAGKTYAALGVEVDMECSIQINVPETGFSELHELEIPVNLYKVADIAVSGKYTVTADFEDKGLDALENVSDTTSADVWKQLAEAAKKAVDDGLEAGTPIEAVGTTDVEEAPTAIIVNGTVTIGTTKEDKLPVGLYLVDAQSVESAIYRYSFQPYLISLPNNNYYKAAEGTDGDDTWIYNLVNNAQGNNAVGLKPDKEDLYGSLVIEKTVDVFNGTYDSATFVFQVEAVKADPDAAEGSEPAKVFSDVFAMNFTGPGAQTLTVGPIPAGAQVTVKEVYSGSGYSVKEETEDTQDTVIIADEVLAKDPESTVATVSFTNTHDGRHNGGNGIVNTFSYDDGEWTYEAQRR